VSEKLVKGVRKKIAARNAPAMIFVPMFTALFSKTFHLHHLYFL
jgi:hypothetical protein